MLLGATAALTAVVAAAATAAPPPPPPPPPWTDDPPQPRGPSWAPGLPSPPLAIDPRNRSALPPSAPFGPYSSADFGLPHNATPGYSTLGDSLYTFGVAVAGRYVYAAPYATHVVHRWDIGTGQQKTIHIKSEFFGRPGTFAIAAAPDGGALYLGLDGDGCMPGNPASRAQPCAMVRRIAADGHERIVLRNLTTPKQMTFDMQGRLYITEEWRRRIVRWDPAHPDLAPEVVVNATDTLAAGQNQLQPVEGVAVATNGDIYFSLCVQCHRRNYTLYAAVTFRRAANTSIGAGMGAAAARLGIHRGVGEPNSRAPLSEHGSLQLTNTPRASVCFSGWWKGWRSRRGRSRSSAQPAAESTPLLSVRGHRSPQSSHASRRVFMQLRLWLACVTCVVCVTRCIRNSTTALCGRNLALPGAGAAHRPARSNRSTARQSGRSRAVHRERSQRMGPGQQRHHLPPGSG
jgi:hypothetical protein